MVLKAKGVVVGEFVVALNAQATTVKGGVLGIVVVKMQKRRQDRSSIRAKEFPNWNALMRLICACHLVWVTSGHLSI